MGNYNNIGKDSNNINTNYYNNNKFEQWMDINNLKLIILVIKYT